MAIGKTAYIREFTEDEIRTLKDIAENQDLKNATDVLRFCLKWYHPNSNRIHELKQEVRQLETQLADSDRELCFLKDQLRIYFNKEKELKRNKRGLIALLDD